MLDAVSDIQEIDVVAWGRGAVIGVCHGCFGNGNANGVAHGDAVVVAGIALYVVGANGISIAVGNMVDRDLSAIVWRVRGCVRQKDQSVGVDGHPVDIWA